MPSSTSEKGKEKAIYLGRSFMIQDRQTTQQESIPSHAQVHPSMINQIVRSRPKNHIPLRFFVIEVNVSREDSCLLAHGGGTTLAGIGSLGLGLGDTLGEDGSILVSSILGTLSIATLESEAVTLVLKTLGSNQTLDLGCLGVWLLALALWLNLTTDNEFADIVFLGETEEAADLGGALRTKTLGVDDIGEAGDVVVALLDDGESENGEIHGDDASTDRLALALTGAAGSVAGVTI